MCQFTPFHLAISNKLGWGDMLAEIALPSIDRIISNHAGHIFDCTGDVIDSENVAASLLQDSWSADEVFGLLVSPDYLTWENEKDLFIAFRCEIEELMKCGIDFFNAIAE